MKKLYKKNHFFSIFLLWRIFSPRNINYKGRHTAYKMCRAMCTITCTKNYRCKTNISKINIFFGKYIFAISDTKNQSYATNCSGSNFSALSKYFMKTDTENMIQTSKTHTHHNLLYIGDFLGSRGREGGGREILDSFNVHIIIIKCTFASQTRSKSRQFRLCHSTCYY